MYSGMDDMRFAALLATTLLMAVSTPSMAQEKGTPAFRVPIGGSTSTSSAPPSYAWMQTVGTCSNACGDGTRTTSYQCQNVSDYDFSGGGYGAPEADSNCTAARPSSTSTACTNYSGCGYDWVKPPVAVTRIPKPNSQGGTFPVGGDDSCSYGKRVFSPYCQRTSGSPVTMPKGDHAFCRSDRPDYDDVANGVPDALGYDRTGDETASCVAGGRDYGWKPSAWSAPSSTCAALPTRTRTVECVLKFNGTGAADAKCAGVTKPATSETMLADFTGCSVEWEAGAWGSFSSGCSDSATRTRTVVCRRSDGTAIADAACLVTGAKPATSETKPNLVSCTYSWSMPSAWSYASQCSDSTTRTRTTTCQRSDGKTVADSSCTTAKPSTSESGVSNLTGCTYTTRDQGKSACTAQGTQQQYWDCTRSDGTTGFPASYCGKTNPETVGCTPPPPIYTYTPVNRGESTCSNNQKNVYWDCTRNDGVTGFPASNCGKTNPEVVGCVMPYTYAWSVGGWSAYSSSCSANASQTRTVFCRRDQDGAQVADSSCGGTRPNDVQYGSNLTGCTYTAGYGNWSTCTNNSQTRPVSCTRSDGANVDPSSCGIQASNGQQSQTCVSDPYPVVYGKTCGENPIRAQCDAKGPDYATKCMGGTVIFTGAWNNLGIGMGNPGGYNPMSTPGYCITSAGSDMWFNGIHEVRRDATLQCVKLAAWERYTWGGLAADCRPQDYTDTVTVPNIPKDQVPADVTCTGTAIKTVVGGYYVPRATRCIYTQPDYTTSTYYTGPATKAHPNIRVYEYPVEK